MLFYRKNQRLLGSLHVTKHPKGGFYSVKGNVTFGRPLTTCISNLIATFVLEIASIHEFSTCFRFR